jgi:rubrerythrin
MIHLKSELMQPLREASAQNDPTQMQSAIQKSLQNAIALEFATIPTYLYAWWSLDETKNPMIRRLLNRIVLEEMSHMAIASNILNAVGGSPQIVGAVPTYPGGRYQEVSRAD